MTAWHGMPTHYASTNATGTDALRAEAGHTGSTNGWLSTVLRPAHTGANGARANV